MIQVYFVNGNALECECNAQEDSDPLDYIEEFSFATLQEVEAFEIGIKTGSRYDDTESSCFLDKDEALKCAKQAMKDWFGDEK